MTVIPQGVVWPIDRYPRKGDRTATPPATCDKEERFYFSSSSLTWSFPPSRLRLMSRVCSRDLVELVVLVVVDQAKSVDLV